MKKRTATFVSAVGVFALSLLSASAQVVLSEDFESYDPGSYPSSVNFASGTPAPFVVVDSGNVFGKGTDNQFLRFEQVHNLTFSLKLPTPAEAVSISFDMIPRNLAGDGRWLNLQFFADETGTATNNPARANMPQFVLRTGKLRTGEEFGRVNEATRIQVFFNNGLESINYRTPAGGVATLGSGKSAIWAGTSLVVDDYNENRTSEASLGHGVHTIRYLVESNTNAIMSFDLDDIVIAAIPEPSTYAVIFGGLALAGAFVIRRRQR